MAETDILKETSAMYHDLDKNEAAMKWIAPAVFHGINANAQSIPFIVEIPGAPQVSIAVFFVFPFWPSHTTLLLMSGSFLWYYFFFVFFAIYIGATSFF